MKHRVVESMRSLQNRLRCAGRVRLIGSITKKELIATNNKKSNY